MKSGFRQSMSWLHTWAGLVVGWLLFFMFLTGTLGYASAEIDRWMRPETPVRPATQSTADMTAMAEARLLATAQDADSWTIQFPRRGRSIGWSHDLSIGWIPGADEVIDLATGVAVPRAEQRSLRETAGGRTLYRMHYLFHYIPPSVALWIAGICTMLMFVACVTGVIVHKKIFADFFTFRPRKGQRSWLDLHTLMSVTALPFHLMITYTGLVFIAYLYALPIIAASYGAGEAERAVFQDQMYDGAMTENAARSLQVEPAGIVAPLTPLVPLLATVERQWGKHNISSVDVYHPGDANARIHIWSGENLSRQSEGLLFDGVSGELLRYDAVPSRTAPKAIADVSMALHEGLFAGPVLRWLYFTTSLLGTAMIGTGLVLWSTKRKARLKDTEKPDFGIAAVDVLNVGTIVGLPIGIAAYFWANRLIPAGIEGRAEWEPHAMFIAWALTFLYAAWRPKARVWIELCGLAALAWGFLPIINALTTDRHLGVTVPVGDWQLASIDLGMLGAGIFFACLAMGMRRKQRASTMPRPFRRRGAKLGLESVE